MSPHLQIWRWGPGMVASILHRITGVGATVGIAILLWWLAALLRGPESYDRFRTLFWGPVDDWSTGSAALWSLIHLVLRIVVIGVSWSVIAHAVTGIRHFVLDTGAGYELEQNKLWANVSTAAGILLTVVFWALLLTR